MSWTELKDGRWTPRQVTTDGITIDSVKGEGDTPKPLDGIDSFLFCPVSVSSLSDPSPFKITISVYSTNTALAKAGEFDFTAGQLLSKKTLDAGDSFETSFTRPISFGYMKTPTKPSPGSTEAIGGARNEVIKKLFSEIHSYQGYIDGTSSEKDGLITKTPDMLSQPFVFYRSPQDSYSEIHINSIIKPFFHQFAPEVCILLLSLFEISIATKTFRLATYHF